jgi:hypothetical protein
MYIVHVSAEALITYRMTQSGTNSSPAEVSINAGIVLKAYLE